jgi:hypothetical protein
MSDFNQIWIFSIFVKTPITKFRRRMDMTKVIGACRDYANAPKTLGGGGVLLLLTPIHV